MWENICVRQCSGTDNKIDKFLAFMKVYILGREQKTIIMMPDGDKC